MSTSLKDRLDALKASLTDVLSDCKSALNLKGVSVDDNTYKLSSIANYILQIFQSDYNFIMYFNEIDQFGNPHVPNQGHETSGFSDYNPMLELVTVPLSELLIDQIPTEFITNLGAFGIPSGNTGISIESFDLDNVFNLDFNKISSIPEELSVL